jgi:transcriptional regulator with XRE-family HTH domain
MVALPDHDPTARGPLLAKILGAVRRFRKRRLADVAVEMAMKQRTYEHFEGGKGPFNVDRIHQLADLLGVDPHGIFAALAIASPAFAIRTADNQFMTIFLMALRGFDERTGDAIARLDAYTLMDAFKEMFDGLETKARAHDNFLGQLRPKKTPGTPDDDASGA